MKVALVHDDLVQFGGAEKVLLAFHEIWPEAPVYTSFVSGPWVNLSRKLGIEIKTSFLQSLPKIGEWYRYYGVTPLYALAFESFNLSRFDLVISSSSRFAHGIIVKPKTTHVAYVHSPNRSLWEFNGYMKSESGVAAKLKGSLHLPLSYLRQWDFVSMQRVDHVIANSRNVADKVGKFYARSAEVVYPFCEVSSFAQGGNVSSDQGYFLVISRLVSWKRIEIAIKACSDLGLRLKIVGEGPDRKRLEGLSGSKTEFVGFVSEEKKRELIYGSSALIVTQSEDFGITALEAMACGKPVLAFGGGGAVETVLEGITGDFFNDQTPESLGKLLLAFNPAKYSKQDCIKRAEQFDKNVFISRIKSCIGEYVLQS